MNKTLKQMLAALTTISAGTVMAQQKNVDNCVNSTGTPWRNGDGTLCWRDAAWTPATAAANCDGWLAPKPAAAPAKPAAATESKGKADPVASNATAEGRAKNRRAVIEVVGTQPVK